MRVPKYYDFKARPIGKRYVGNQTGKFSTCIQYFQYSNGGNMMAIGFELIFLFCI